MSVTDLSGTRWLINGTWDNSAFSTTGVFSIYFHCPDAQKASTTYYQNCKGVNVDTSGMITLKDIGGTQTSFSSFNSTYRMYRLWYIWGGEDATNQDLIDWLELNAVQQDLTEEYITNTYDLTQVANAVRNITKSYIGLSYPSAMASALNNIGDFWTIEQMMSGGTNYGDLYYNGSRTTIPSYAFAGKKFNNVSFPNVTIISDYAFQFAWTKLVSFPECTSIGNYAFYTCYSLTTASFPKVTSIGSSAFYQCNSLTTASFPLCTTIGSYAFSNCIRLATISFPNCTSIGNYAFAYCSSLTTASFSKCTTIGNYAFQQCYSLATLSFPSCTTIGNYAFYNCSSLTTVSFSSCTSIGSYAFYNCSSLTTVSFPSCTSISNQAFQYCSSLTTASFPKCNFINGYAFQSCISLSEISLPTLTSISGNSVFASCYNLISLNLTGVSLVPSLQYSNIFSSTPIGGYSTSAGQYGSIYVPASLYDAFKSATNWTYFSSRMVSV